MLQKLKIFSLMGLCIFSGVLFSTDIFSQTTATVDITNPTDGSIVRGTCSISAGITVSYGFQQTPTHGPRNSNFGWRPTTNSFHYGVDTADQNNTPVRAVEGGTAYVSWFTGYGRTVIIDHGDELYTLYAHLSTYTVSSGQQVNANAVIGRSGNSGGNYGYHLHFGVTQVPQGTNLTWEDIGADHTVSQYRINPDDYLPTARIRVNTTIDRNQLHSHDYPAGTTNISYSTPWNTTQNEDGTHTVGVETQRLSTLANGNLDTREIGTDSVQVIVDNSTRVVEVPIQKSASPATPIAGGFQAASSLFFWDNQGNRWERWINSNLRVDSDNIIRYNAGTSNLDNPNLRHRVYLESRIYPPGSMYPKASCVNKKEMQAITYTYASQPFALLPFTKED
ncbi:MAG: M23 family metallopeptidase, partial [bacterium]